MLPSEPGTTGSLFKVEDWAALPDDVRGELVNGRLEEEEVPDLVHEVIVIWFASMLRAWVAPLGGFVAGSDVKFTLGPGRAGSLTSRCSCLGAPSPRGGGPSASHPT